MMSEQKFVENHDRAATRYAYTRRIYNNQCQLANEGPILI